MEKLPLRPNVCLLIFNQEHKLFLGQRLSEPGVWQLPQGGAEPQFSLEENALREATEELGVEKKSLRIIKKLEAVYQYEFDRVPDYARGRWRGQQQTFWLLQFLGSDSEINLQKHEPEFSSWKWCTVDQVKKTTEPKRLPGYLPALQEVELFFSGNQSPDKIDKANKFLKRFLFVVISLLCFVVVTLYNPKKLRLRVLCFFGNAISCAGYGHWEEKNGHLAEAVKWYQRGCALDNADNNISCAALGRYEEQRNNIIEAKKWYQRGCATGHGKSCLALGAIELSGGNTAAARKWYKIAWEKGSNRASSALGGLEVREGNYAEAKKWYKRGCDLRDAGECFLLGELMKKEGDVSAGTKLIIDACRQGYSPACQDVSSIKIDEEKVDDDEIKEVFRAACDDGDTKSCRRLGDMELQAGNKKRARTVFLKACNAGDNRACQLLMKTAD